MAMVGDIKEKLAKRVTRHSSGRDRGDRYAPARFGSPAKMASAYWTQNMITLYLALCWFTLNTRCANAIIAY